jgi:hypothetical protein
VAQQLVVDVRDTDDPEALAALAQLDARATALLKAA